MATLSFSDNINTKLAEFKTEDFFNQEVIRPLIDLIDVEITVPDFLLLIIKELTKLTDLFKSSSGAGGDSIDLGSLLQGLMNDMNIPLELRSIIMSLEDVYCNGIDLDFNLPNIRLGSLEFLIMALTFKFSLCDKPNKLDTSFFLNIFLSSSKLPSIGTNITNILNEYNSVPNNPSTVESVIALNALSESTLEYYTPSMMTTSEEIKELEDTKNLLMSNLTNMLVNEEYIANRVVGGEPFAGSPLDFSNDPSKDTIVDNSPYPNNGIYKGYVPVFDIGINERIRYNGKNITGIRSLVSKIEELDIDINTRKTSLDNDLNSISAIETTLEDINKLKSIIDSNDLTKRSLKNQLDTLLLSSKDEVIKAHTKTLDLTSLVVGLLANDSKIEDSQFIAGVNGLVRDIVSSDMEKTLEEHRIRLSKSHNSRFKGFTPVFDEYDSRPFRVSLDADVGVSAESPSEANLGTAIDIKQIDNSTYIGISPSIGKYNLEEVSEKHKPNKELQDVFTKVNEVSNYTKLNNKRQVEELLDNIDKYDEPIPVEDRFIKSFGKKHYLNTTSVVKDVGPLDNHTLTDEEAIRIL